MMKNTAVRSTRQPKIPPTIAPAIAPVGNFLCKWSPFGNVETSVVVLTGVVILTGVVVLACIFVILAKTRPSPASSNPSSGLVLFAFPVALGANTKY